MGDGGALIGVFPFDSIMGSDYNVALVALLFATIVILTSNLVADLGYVALDPRISLDGGRGPRA